MVREIEGDWMKSTEHTRIARDSHTASEVDDITSLYSDTETLFSQLRGLESGQTVEVVTLADDGSKTREFEFDTLKRDRSSRHEEKVAARFLDDDGRKWYAEVKVSPSEFGDSVTTVFKRYEGNYKGAKYSNEERLTGVWEKHI